MKKSLGVSFQKVNYDGTQIEDILKGISLLPWLFEYYTGDEEEILKGQKYTAYYKFDFKTRKPTNLLHYLFQPDTSFFLGLTYIDVSIDHYFYTASTDQISERDFGSATLFGTKIGFSFNFIRDPYPIFIKLLVDAEYTPIGNLDYTDKFNDLIFDKNRVYFHFNLYFGLRF